MGCNCVKQKKNLATTDETKERLELSRRPWNIFFLYFHIFTYFYIFLFLFLKNKNENNNNIDDE